MPDESRQSAKVEYYLAKTAAHPNLYPAYAQLGAAYLEEAKANHDPVCLQKARTALHRSIEIQPNFDAFLVLSEVANFSHRFTEGLQWAQRASEAFPGDTTSRALWVEALLGLGRYQEAEEVVASFGRAKNDFHTWVARARWLESRGRVDDSVDAFLAAAKVAEAAAAPDFRQWAVVSAAGTLLDSGRLVEAEARLSEAHRADPQDTLLRLHLAELRQRQGRLKEALSIYERLLSESPDDPELSARAYALSRTLGLTRQRQHFAAAESGFKKAIDAGEVYTLGSMARLLGHTENRLASAVHLARQNLEYKRDHQAYHTLESLERRLAGNRNNSGSR